MRRREKSLVYSTYIRPRINYCNKVIETHQPKLERRANSDGIVLFLDPIESANEQTQMRPLGALVRRKTDRMNALYADCVSFEVLWGGRGAPPPTPAKLEKGCGAQVQSQGHRLVSRSEELEHQLASVCGILEFSQLLTKHCH